MPPRKPTAGFSIPNAPILLLLACVTLVSGCKEANTLITEVRDKVFKQYLQPKEPFVPRDGITVKTCPLYQAANHNSPVIRRLPAESTVHLVDRTGDWFRVRTRDGREGYLFNKLVAGEKIIRRTLELKRSIERLPVQAEGILKSKANFRLYPGRDHKTLDLIPQGAKFEMYERVVTLRRTQDHVRPAASKPTGPVGNPAPEPAAVGPTPDEAVKKDVWYKVKLEDGRVGFIYTHNLKFTPPPEIVAKKVNWLRIVAWRAVSATDDPDFGAKKNYVVAYAPLGKDPGCDYTQLYYMFWHTKKKKLDNSRPLKNSYVLPITDFHFERRPGFSVRYLHPVKPDRLVMASYVYSQSRGRFKRISEEEIPNPAELR